MVFNILRDWIGSILNGRTALILNIVGVLIRRKKMVVAENVLDIPYQDFS